MSSPYVLNIHIDGAARGNPGPAAYGLVILRNGEAVLEENGCLGSTTNNVAEYTALVRALERAAPFAAQAQRVAIQSDSELLVKQMKGEYRVKNEKLQVLHAQAKKLWNHFSHITIRHVLREENKWADRLCNEALDGNVKKPAEAVAVSGHGKGKKGAASLQEEALACLRAAASDWARGDAGNPPPEAVWEQLCDILEKHDKMTR